MVKTRTFSHTWRSLFFHLCVAIVTPPYAIFACLLAPLPHAQRYKLITSWTHLIIWMARVICRIHFQVIGQELIPQKACIFALKHSSAWETFAAQIIFPPQVWILKRELLWIPFFGWGLKQLDPIAINRSAGAKALRTMVQQAKERISRGLSIIVFPEGTRTLPGVRGEYKSGAAYLARALNVPIVPVTHNAGYLWAKNDWYRYPGIITIKIGEPLNPEEYSSTHTLTHALETWIEGNLAHLDDPHIKN
jgi:1-acyl-sn-glycerol-3-phosphate acyltransferase